MPFKRVPYNGHTQGTCAAWVGGLRGAQAIRNLRTGHMSWASKLVSMSSSR
jgi:hypothetical protein